MDENVKNTPSVSSANIEHKQSPAFDPRDDYPDRDFDNNLHNHPCYDNTCMPCRHWICDACNHKDKTCNYKQS